MTAPNHALTGAAIGLLVPAPLLALPLAFLSHFACDAIPHYDQPGSRVERIRSRRFFIEQIALGGILCVVLVLLLAVKRPQHWLAAAVCAFLAASPDLFWIPRFLSVKRTGKEHVTRNPYLRLHSAIQWKTGPRWLWLELAWLLGFGWLVLSHL